MDALAVRRKCVVEHVVARTRDSEDVILVIDAQLLHVDIGIFPCLPIWVN